MGTHDHRDEIDYSYETEHDHGRPGRGGSPGKAPTTARLAGRPQTNIIFRVADAASATALGSALGQRNSNGVADTAHAAVDRAKSSNGSPLPEDLRTRFEGSLGSDLSGVRIHTDSAAADASQALGARAYTVGQDIHFNAGQYNPVDPFGVHLIAHEVAHTVQQSGGTPRVQNKLAVSTPGDAVEQEADNAADAMVKAEPIAVRPSQLSSVGIQRDVDQDKLDQASSARAHEKSKDHSWGGSDLHTTDEDGAVVDNDQNPVVANVKRQGKVAMKLMSEMSRELDIIKPSVIAWQAADAAVESLAGSSGIDYRQPYLYANEFNVMEERLKQNATNTDGDASEVIKHLDAAKNAKVSKAVGTLKVALKSMEGAKAKLEHRKNELQQAKVSKDLKDNAAAKAKIDAAISDAVTTITTIGTIVATIYGGVAALEASGVGGGVSLPAEGPGSAVSAPSNPYLPSGGGAAGSKAAGAGAGLTMFFEATLWRQDIAKCTAQAAALNSKLTGLQADASHLATVSIEAEFSATVAAVDTAATEVKDAQATYMTKLIDAGKAWDQRKRDKDPKKTKEGETVYHPDKKHETSMESLLAMEACLTKRGNARDAFGEASSRLQHIQPGVAERIVAMALQTSNTKVGPDGTLIRGRIDDNASGAEGSTLKMIVAKLEGGVQFVLDHVEHHKQNADKDKGEETGWHAAVSKATTRHV